MEVVYFFISLNFLKVIIRKIKNWQIYIYIYVCEKRDILSTLTPKKEFLKFTVSTIYYLNACAHYCMNIKLHKEGC